jgi:hypothetical protein
MNAVEAVSYQLLPKKQQKKKTHFFPSLLHAKNTDK